MEEMADKETVAEMKIPWSPKEAFFPGVIYAIIVVFVGLAIFNLVSLQAMPGDALIASILWLLLVSLWVRKACREAGGARQFVVNLGGEFAPRQMAEINRLDAGTLVLCLGYRLFNHRHYYLKVRCDGITLVDWAPGQASGLAGRDMNDWHVVLWFDPEAVRMNQVPHRHGVYMVGPSRRREQTEALGKPFIDFLRPAGVAAAQMDPAALQGLLGRQGVVSRPLHPVGRVTIEGNEYPARGSYLENGTRVEVVDIRGLSLRVQQVKAEPGISSGASGVPPGG